MQSAKLPPLWRPWSLDDKPAQALNMRRLLPFQHIQYNQMCYVPGFHKLRPTYDIFPDGSLNRSWANFDIQNDVDGDSAEARELGILFAACKYSSLQCFKFRRSYCAGHFVPYSKPQFCSDWQEVAPLHGVWCN